MSALLSHLDSLKYQINGMKSLLVTYALAEDAPTERIADWFEATLSEVKHLRGSEWITAQVAAARGEEFGEGNYDAAEVYRSAQAIIRAGKLYGSNVEEIATVLALKLISEGSLQKHDWLDERAKKYIRQGWFIQSRRVPGTRSSDAEKPTQETQSAPVEISAA